MVMELKTKSSLVHQATLSRAMDNLELYTLEVSILTAQFQKLMLISHTYKVSLDILDSVIQLLL